MENYHDFLFLSDAMRHLLNQKSMGLGHSETMPTRWPDGGKPRGFQPNPFLRVQKQRVYNIHVILYIIKIYILYILYYILIK